MSVGGTLRRWVNSGLRPFGVRFETLAAQRAESRRLAALVERRQFEGPVFPLLPAFESLDAERILERVRCYGSETARFAGVGEAERFQFANDYFTSPDAEVAYAITRDLCPRRIVEIGSGNSTRLFREALRDGGSDAELVSIDPDPRREVEGIADRVVRRRVEELDAEEICGWLDAGDFLFIDSSHEIEAGNDVVTLLLRVVPALRPGVLVHVHDVFLPFEYPREWLVDGGWRWSEQYLVQALLQDSEALEVLWPGHYLQRTRADFAAHFAAPELGRGSSLWLRKVR